MKKLTTSIVVALFSATVFAPAHVDASWLSKTLKKFEASWNAMAERERASKEGSVDKVEEDEQDSQNSTSTIRLPQKSDYPRNYRVGQMVGYRLSAEEYAIAGVHVNSTYEEIRRVLGEPTEEVHHELRRDGEQKAFMRYGGITYRSIYGQIETAGDIVVVNRDAVTYRGIAVGDSLEQVYKVYGRPTHIFDDGSWFYGVFKWTTDYIGGIYFENDGVKVTKIRVI